CWLESYISLRVVIWLRYKQSGIPPWARPAADTMPVYRNAVPANNIILFMNILTHGFVMP
ncbi:hypothetical protein AAEI00_04550, partial [Shewanella algae]|uniref:hypothetical protein n=1 Tax=Shewanella algae TaxID=38313 RepID=UPI003187550D